jgi:hypothetical protein
MLAVVVDVSLLAFHSVIKEGWAIEKNIVFCNKEVKIRWRGRD